jgi:ABC-type phosphate transport system substrate-binding protein
MISLLLGCLWAAGSLRVCGSETLGRVGNAWGEGWNVQSPHISVETHFPGSRTSLNALAESNCQVALLSFAPDPVQKNQVQRKIRAKIVLEQAGWDEVVFFTNLSNSVKSLRIDELRSALARPRGKWNVYGRNALSGTRSWVLENILGGDRFALGTRELPGPEGVVRAVASDPKGIGYSGKESIHGQVRILALADEHGRPLRLMRPLFLAYFENDTLARQFSRYVLSAQGQAQLSHCGLLPMGAKP